MVQHARRRYGAVILLTGMAASALTGIAITTTSANATPPAPSTSPSVRAANTAARLVNSRAGVLHASPNPYSPANGHAYRHGVIPTVSQQAKMNAYAKAHPSTVTATGPQTLSYGGGVDGIGVQSGHSKVYLVFYGTQWGTSSTDANGNLKFTGDSAGAAGVAQQMFKGIGTNGELWSADLTQWCDGPGVAAGATACPATGVNYIPYQTGGVLSGVWYDNAAASPAAASALQLGQEAVKAAGHFGNTAAASNRYAYYVILSPHGTNPDNYQTRNFCAWHDWNGDFGASSPYGDIAFSNQPYNIDRGTSCGVGFVNTPGTTDGYTITLGHEWHEMMSDQNPLGGWSNHSASSYGQENSDECVWLAPGTSGGAANISFGSFGTYAEQASWSNDTNNCAISHAIVHHGTCSSPGQKLGNPGFETGTAAPWSASAGVINDYPGMPPHTGSWYAWMMGYGISYTDTMSQSVTIPAGCTATFSFWLHIETAQNPNNAVYDTLTVKAGATTLATFSNLNQNTGYTLYSFNVSSLAGQTVLISFNGVEDSSLPTHFVIDDTSLTAS
jgi:hypothetical protein